MKKTYISLLLLTTALLSCCGKSVDSETINESETISESISNQKIILQADKYSISIGERVNFSYRTINFSSDVIVQSSDDNIVSIKDDSLLGVGAGICSIIAYKKDDSNVKTQMQIEVIKDEECSSFNYYEFDQYFGRRKSLNSIGEMNVLVLPIEVKDYEANATEENLTRLDKMFNAKSDDILFESVSSYYEKSSYGKLKLNFVIPPSWYKCNLNPLEIQETYNINSGVESDGGSGKLIAAALQWYKDTYTFDNAKFDQNQDGWVDAIWAIYSCPTMAQEKEKYEALYPGIDTNNYWAFTTSAFQYNNRGGKGDVNSPLVKVYSWASYDFMDKYKNTTYNYDIDSHTYIHETGHLFGLKDYYCASSPYYTQLGAIDMMDMNIGDHCAFSKFALGWVKPRIIKNSRTVSLKPFEENGDCIILASENYNNTAFDEYFMIEYITPTNLNEMDYLSPYPDNGLQGYSKPGIRITHIDNPAVAAGNGELLTYLTDPESFSTDPVSNTPYFYIDTTINSTSERMYQYQITLMQKNFKDASKNVLSENREYYYDITFDENNNRNINPDDSLFYAGESFSLERGSQYRKLMPTKSAYLNKYYHTNNSSDIFDFKIEVKSINETESIIEITKIEENLF